MLVMELRALQMPVNGSTIELYLPAPKPTLLLKMSLAEVFTEALVRTPSLEQQWPMV